MKNIGILNYILWRIKQFSYSPEDVALQITPYIFDAYAASLYSALLSGGSVVLIEQKYKLDISHIVQLIKTHGVTNSCMTPGFYNVILDELELQEGLENLRFLVLAGEKASGKVLERSLLNLPHIALHNEYGPTEASVAATFNLGLNPYNTAIIGKPIANTKIYILDGFNRLVPIGVPGELCIGGIGVAKGYLNNAVLSREKFIENPNVPEEKIYKTGDLARWHEEGTIEFLGRIDNQIKIRGYRIEPAEIENKIRAYPGIDEALVLLILAGTDQLTAYFTAKKQVDTAGMKQFLSGQLPDYMVPAHFVQLENIPIKPNGKLDKKALPYPLTKQDEVRSATVPSGKVQQDLLRIWEEILGHDQIGIHKNFFDLGGDSLKMIQLSSKIKKHFGKSVSIAELFGNPTIADLANYIDPSDQKNIASGIGNTSVKQEINGVSKPTDVAIIGIAARLPESGNSLEFWKHLRAGKDLIHRGEEEKERPNLVKAKGFMEEADAFDAEFFGYLPSEAEMMDPQIRVFHEVVWTALEDAGYDPLLYKGNIGLFGGASTNPFYDVSLDPTSKEDWMEKWDKVTYADKDYLCQRVLTNLI